MRIFFVCDTMGSGGAEKVISALSNFFVLQGHEVSIVMLSNEAGESFYKLSEKIKLLYLTDNQKSLGILKKTKILKKILVEKNPDIVISFLSYVCIYTWCALRHTNIPYIVSERNDPNQRGFLKQLLLNCSFKRAAGCVFQTSDALEWYNRIGKVRKTVIYNPVNLDFSPTNVPNRKKQILYVGRFTNQKNCLMLIEAFNLFFSKHPDYVLRMFGNGPLEKEIKASIAVKKLSDKVLVQSSSKTWQKDEYDSAMFVLPSKYEGMPNVLAEALCLGIPSVSTNCSIGGPKELKKIFHDQLVLSEKNDANTFAETMEQCIDVKYNNIGIPNELKINDISLKWLNFTQEILNER